MKGFNSRKIASILTTEKVPTPIIYYAERNRKCSARSEYAEIWCRPTIQHILSQQAYAGRTVNFKTTKKSFKNKKKINLPKEQWKVFEGTQEAIIEPKIFDMVQTMLEHKKAYTKYEETNMFNGLVYCANCGAKLYMARMAKDRSLDYFTCSTYRKKKKGLCTSHKIKVEDLEKIIPEDIRKVCSYVKSYEQEFIEDYCKCSEKEMRKTETLAKAELSKLLKRNEEIDSIIRKLYEDNVVGRISDERFDTMSKSYDKEQNEIKVKIAILKESISKTNEKSTNVADFVKTIQSITRIETLTPEILHSMISKIFVGETTKIQGIKTQEIKIIYNLVGAINLPKEKESKI